MRTMSTKFSFLLRPLLSGLILFAAFVVGGIALDTVLASWSPPSVAPPGNNAEPPLNTSSTGQNKASWLTFDGGGTRLDTYFATVSGNVGIGTASPDHYHLPRGSSGYTTLTIEPTADQRHGVLELAGRNRTDGGGFGAIIHARN